MAAASLLRRGMGDKADPYDPDADRLLPPSAGRRKRHQVRIQGQLVLVRSVSAVNLGTTAPATPQTATPPVPAVPNTRRQSTVPRGHDPAVGSVVGSKAQQQSRQSRQRRQQQQQRKKNPGAGTGTGTSAAMAAAARRRRSLGAAAGPESEERWWRSSAEMEAGDGIHSSHENELAGDGGVASGSDSEIEEDEQETALRDRQRRGYGIGGAGNIRRPTEVVRFYSSSNRAASTPPGHERGGRRRWQWMSSLLGLRGKKDEGSQAATGDVGIGGVDVVGIETARHAGGSS